jgi:uncharacterized protein (TIRG00374 family)
MRSNGAGEPQPSGRRQVLRRLGLAAVLLVVVVSALTIAADAGDLVEALRRFDWRWTPLILGLTTWNYWWRFVKWHLYLRALDVPPIPVSLNLRIFLAGFAMSVTPGKVGELIKAIYVSRFTGAPAARVSGAVAVERVTDGLAMLLLALVGAAAFDYGRPFLVAFLLLAALGVALLQRPALLLRLLRWAERLPLIGRVALRVEAFLAASSTLVQPRPLAWATGLGVLAWSGECVAFFLILVALDIPPSWELLLVATFVLAVSSLAGGASLLPGGLGVTDASVAGMLTALVSGPEMDRATAVAATLLVRFATLWFAVLVGFIMVGILERGSTVRRSDDRGAASAMGGQT